ncbi:MAG: GNAT family N-acetyltransferase [Hyphomicrobiales bacterium]|nr:GNAT family N-acetyltransferase [Hyphomicrobiales bacterium]
MTKPNILITREAKIPLAEYIGVLEASGLRARRPVDPDRIATMIANSNLIMAARDSGRLIGVSRCISDFAFNCYCSDLAVDKAYQGQGVGHALIDATIAQLHPKASFYLTSAPDAVSFYERIGMSRNDRAFCIMPPDRL